MGAGYRAAEIHAVALRHDAMNADLTAKPRMIPIENLAELGSVGVPKPCCTTRIGRTGPSATSHRSCCKIPAEHPACRRDEGRKLQPPAVQRVVSDHETQDSPSDRRRKGSQVMTTAENRRRAAGKSCSDTRRKATGKIAQGSPFCGRRGNRPRWLGGVRSGGIASVGRAPLRICGIAGVLIYRNTASCCAPIPLLGSEQELFKIVR